MKTQLSKPARDRASYTDEYKQEALELGGPAAAVPRRLRRSLGFVPRCCTAGRTWSAGPTQPGRAKALPQRRRARSRVRRLREENAKLLEQREVLKKSLGILSEAPPRGMPESNR